MNAKRIASLLRQLSSLQAELADAFEQEAPKRTKKRKVAAPEGEVTQEAKDAARRALRKAGVAA